MKGRLNSEYGQITISSDVIATYAGSVAVGCFGIVGMAAYSVKDGLFNKISLVIHCIVSYGVSIPTITENLVEALKYKLEQFTGMKVENVEILVEGIRVID